MRRGYCVKRQRLFFVINKLLEPWNLISGANSGLAALIHSGVSRKERTPLAVLTLFLFSQFARA